MNDYFDELETGLRDAVRRRAHLRWYSRLLERSLRHPVLTVAITSLVVATPAVAAVGAAAGWFSRGASGIYYPASATSGLGKVLPNGGALLPIRVADPDGGPPWGLRLVKTTRGQTCIQVGRVVGGQIGQLGIDTAWHNDHKFHEIKPNNQLADLCGSTDAAGHGFVSQGSHGAPASVDVPLDNSGGSPNACVDPYMSPNAPFAGRPGKLPPRLKKVRKRILQQRRADGDCPRDAMRIIFAGLLGPDAKSITYKTPGGQTRTERTAGGVGAYLIVFRETASDCSDYTQSLLSSSNGCDSNGNPGATPDLQGPSAVTSVTYANGKTCSDQPSTTFASAFRKFEHDARKLHGKLARRAWERFLAAHHADQRNWLQLIQPQCPPVGWVAPNPPKLTTADVASPIKLTLIDARRFCVPKSQRTFQGAIGCDRRVPKGDRFIYGTKPVRKTILVTISFVARQPVTTDNSWYQGAIKNPGNHGGGGLGTDTNIRAGQRITLSTFLGTNLKGTYQGIMTFVQNTGQNGQDGVRAIGLLLGRRNGINAPKGALVVGRFGFKLPLKP